MKVFGTLLRFTPTALLSWIAAWQGIFRGTELVHPQWSDAALSTGAALACVLTVIVIACLSSMGRRAAFVSLALFVVLSSVALAFCIYFRKELIAAPDMTQQEQYKAMWKWSLISMLTFVPQVVGSAIEAMVRKS
ncbi:MULTISPECIES: hypothetical protein [Rhizobium]|jgi:undecaprenyl pyrophosphate phosphatase UppP|uniref:hypothetical protein n=1 Tax=Rhizobium TaxID=379 RepID=UPI0005695615|nr:hypothetical protein [Rhizobium lusitanum]NTJ07318.1 hypothetical protein [Rhizobium lusitanum]